jgi:tetratricopeptide (TPR) repeat protein
MAAGLLLVGTLALAEVSPPPAPPLLTNLGTYHRPISTTSTAAQAYFDQGLRLLYAFNHEDAQAAFEEAARLDPLCAVCFWGAALTLGPNINLPAIPERAEAAWALLQKARAAASHGSPVEQALIAALAHRYDHPPPTESAAQHALDAAYADAMRKVAKRFPRDADVATLFAEALMDLRPWDFWTPGGTPQPGTAEIVRTLQAVLAAHPDHPGANHYLIHAVEASPHPEAAMASAERLKELEPGAGHLVHMPSHVYIRTGQYAAASEANRQAIAVDAATAHNRPIYAMYVAHNFQFLWASALMEGRSAESLQAARDMLQRVPTDMLKGMPGFDYLLSYPVVGLARFGRWKEVLQEPIPAADFPTAQGLWHGARGIALLRTKDVAGATAELSALEALRQKTASDAKVAMNSAQDVLGIASDVLAAELALAKGDVASALAHFERAVAAEDALQYDEPPDWGVPVRHQLGAALLSARRPREAEAVYRADLQRHPHNGWALFGLWQALEAQGQTAEATRTRLAFDEAWKRADVQLSASAF